MKIIVIIIFFCSFYTLGQLEVDFSTTNQHEKFLFKSVAVDGAYTVEETYEKTGVLKEHYFYTKNKDENSKRVYKVDSVKRYYENGDLAFSGVLLDQKEISLGESEGVKGYLTETSTVSYYKGGSKRAISYKDDTNDKLNYFVCYFDKETNKVIYRKEVFNGEKISGSFFRYKDNNWVVSFYQDGEIKEKWTVSLDIFDPVDSFVLKQVELNDSTIISKPKKLKRYIRGKNIILWGDDMIVSC